MRIGTSKPEESKKRAARVLLGLPRGQACARVTIVMIGRDLAFDASEDACEPEAR